jgi:Tfp pilus assembly protein PilX
MQYAHWLMVAGAVLVVLGFIGFALRKNDAEDHLRRDTSSETIQAALENAEAALEAKLKAKGNRPT